MAGHFIDKMTTKFNPANYKDTYVEEMKALIKQKSKGRKVTVKKEKEPRSGKVQDIMSLLKQSLNKPKRRKSA